MFLLESVVMTNAARAWGGAWMERMHGTSRPDVLEVFGGHAEVSVQAWKHGLLALQPVDLEYGADLTRPAEREDLLDSIRETRPRLVIIEFPCTLWSSLSRMNYRGSSGRQRLEGLRREQRPFLQLTADIAHLQREAGDDFLVENPQNSEARKEKVIQELEEANWTWTTIGHMCRYGLRSPKDRKLLKKPTWWMSSSSEIIDELSLRCQCTKEHGSCLTSAVCEHASRYTPQVGRAIVKGLLRTTVRKEPDRLRRLIAALELRIRGEGVRVQEEGVETLRWLRSQGLTVQQAPGVQLPTGEVVRSAERRAEIAAHASADLRAKTKEVSEEGGACLQRLGNLLWQSEQ